jgi:predicted dinucleotide-binding enzyme
MRIGILGSGLMGAKLGTIFARAGHAVVFSYSRSERKLKRLARESRGTRGLAHRVRPLCMRMRYCWPCTGRASPPY